MTDKLMMLLLTAAPEEDTKGKGSWNPFNGISPDLGPFAELLDSRIDKLLALAWLIGLAYLGFRLIVNVTAFGKAKKGRYGSDLSEAKEDLAWSAGSVVALASIGAIYGALVIF